jgi:hypothetical protein
MIVMTEIDRYEMSDSIDQIRIMRKEFETMEICMIFIDRET